MMVFNSKNIIKYHKIKINFIAILLQFFIFSNNNIEN